MAFRDGPTQREHDRRFRVKWFYWIAGGVLVAVVLIVLLVPGVGDNIEGRLLRWLAGAGS